eukprot:gene4287-4337_t
MLRFLVVAAVVFSASAQAQVLRIGVPSDPTSIDPHFQDLAPNANIGKHVFEALVATGARSEMRPGLATAWKLTDDPRVWEITLRENVRFHDGSAFTAEDAAFSLRRAPVVPNAPATVGRYVRDLTEIAITGPNTLRIRTAEPQPVLPNNLSNIPIVQARIGMAAEPRDFNNGTFAVGTGPYRFVKWEPGAEVRLSGNADWWGGKPGWPEVSVRTLPNNGARVAALLSGDVDLIAAVPTQDVARLRGDPKFAVWDSIANRDVFWSIDAGREQSPFVTAKDGSAIGNPFRDVRVRQAVMLAVNRRLIVERVMEGLAVPATQLVPTGMTGLDAGITLPEPDPAKARALLAEAGYPQGFKLTIHTTVGRYPNDQQQAEAVAQMLSRVGIQTEVASLPVAIFFVQARKHAFSFNLVSWGFSTGDTYLLVRETLHSKGAENYGSYVNPEVDRVLDLARLDTDLVSRGALIAQAQRLAVADVAYLPTHYQLNLSASRKGVVLRPRMDEMTLAQDVGLAP